MNTPDVQATTARWVDDHGECLYRYALVRLRKPEVARLRECLEMNWFDQIAGGRA
jgi:hypothetical protein